MAIQLFELCGKDRNVRFSPFVWRTRLALCRKGLPFEGVPANYHEKDKMAPSGSQTYPVIRDGDKWVADSWAIAEYLEEAYPDKPSLFGTPEGKRFSIFMSHYMGPLIQLRIFFLIAPDIHACLDDGDRDYFYKTRSERVKMPLEDLVGQREKNLSILKTNMAPLREALKTREFLSGPEPLYPDYTAFGAFKWASLTSPLDLLDGEEDIRAWFSRVDGWYRGKVAKLESTPLL